MEESRPVAGDVVAGRFTLLERCGVGGFGEVWRASDGEVPEHEVAVKILRDGLRRDPRVIERFVREARILEDLVHPNVARAISWDTSGEHPFIALEFIRGTALSEELWTRSEEEAHFDRDELLGIFTALAEAVDQAHRRGIVHRDLKPQNVMLVPEGHSRRVKVLDFGIAKILETSASESTTKGRVIGSIQYMAPEQITGVDVDARADVFAAGTILYEMLTLRRAWVWDEADRPVKFCEVHEHDNQRNNRVELLRRVVSEPRPRVTTFRPDLFGAVDRILGRALDPEVSDRFQDVPALVSALASAWPPDEGVTELREEVPLEEPTRAVPDLTAIAPVDLREAPAGATVAVDHLPHARPTDLRSSGAWQPRPSRTPVMIMGALAVVLAAVALFLTARALRPPGRANGVTRPSPPEEDTVPPRRAQVSVRPRVASEPVQSPEGPEPLEAPGPAEPRERPVQRPARRPNPRLKRKPSSLAKRAPKQRSPRPPSEAPELADLRRTLARLQRDPSHSTAARFALATRIEREAARLLDAGDRISVKRCAAQSRIAADRDEALATLGTCLEHLARGERKR